MTCQGRHCIANITRSQAQQALAQHPHAIPPLHPGAEEKGRLGAQMGPWWTSNSPILQTQEFSNRQKISEPGQSSESQWWWPPPMKARWTLRTKVVIFHTSLCPGLEDNPMARSQGHLGPFAKSPCFLHLWTDGVTTLSPGKHGRLGPFHSHKVIDVSYYKVSRGRTGCSLVLKFDGTSWEFLHAFAILWYLC